MAMKKCPVCGEKYSDTYRACPFCEEEKNFRRGKPPRRKGGSRVSQSGPSLLSPVLVIAILLMAALLVYLLFGKAIGEKLGWGKDPAGSNTPGIVTSSGGSVSSGAGSSSVVSSGSGGAFPAGLVIGKLVAVQTEAGGQIEYGIVEPQCDLDSLVQVFIIKDFEVVE